MKFMKKSRQRLLREKRTVLAMISIYCRAHHHNSEALCSECIELAEYAKRRIDACPYRLDKPACVNCPTHCYKPTMRERIRAVMRYAGPRMLLRHPILTLLHLLDKRRRP